MDRYRNARSSFSLEHFQWSRSSGGYEWRTAKLLRPPQRCLFVRDTTTPSVTTEPLLTNPGLIRTFAALEPTEAAFAHFANEYGLLGVDFPAVTVARAMKQVREEQHGLSLARRIRGGYEALGEPFSEWVAAWREVRAVVTLIDVIRTDVNRLKRAVVVRKNGAEVDQVSWPGGLFEVTAQVPPDLRRFSDAAPTQRERVRRLALGWAQGHINIRLAATGVFPRVLFQEGQNRFTLHLVPDTLLGAIELQAARVLADDPDFKQCERSGCGRWFELAANQRRRQSKYCSDRCRQAAYRQRENSKLRKRKPHARRRTRTT